MSVAERFAARVEAAEPRVRCVTCRTTDAAVMRELIESATALRRAGTNVTWRMIRDQAVEEHDGFHADVLTVTRHYRNHEPDLYAAFSEAGQ